jgi:3-hydroxyacyl-CoA dehydrogenase
MTAGPVRYENQDGVGVITLDNPPLNVLSREVRDGLLAAIHKAGEDRAARAVVLTGAGRTLTAGADITEFDGPIRGADLNDICDSIEALDKPVVAAIHGVTMGGGIEISLACHYRVAAKDARLGLPEVKLGLLPGAGGTQRLPRLCGAKAALDLIISGDPVTAGDALKAGLVDEVAVGDCLEAALAFAKVKASLENHPRTRDRNARIEAESGAAIFNERRAELKKRQPYQHAPLRCVDAVENAYLLAFDEGLKRERELFHEAVDDWQSRGLIHLFFAEREAARIPALPRGAKPEGITSVGVVGAGTMGGGIAMAFAGAGVPVIVLDRDQTSLVRGLDVVARNFESMVQRGRLDQAGMDARMGVIRGVLNYAELAGADLVVEAVFEDMAVKEQVFRNLDKVCKQGAILASNTSTLDIDTIASFTSRPEDVVGMHFFSPANVMRLVEVIHGKKTSVETLATAMTAARQIGKIGVSVGNCDGFAGNRMMEKYLTEAIAMVEEGASPSDVDAALTRWGMAMGPFAVCDLAGVDVKWQIRQQRLREGGEFGTPLLDRFYESGRHGQKNLKGFYRYEPGSRAPLSDPEANAIIEAHREELGVRARSVSEQEIVKRAIYALVNEGARLLSEGIAYRSSDIDVMYAYGYGFPGWRGGPMKYAELRSLAEVLADIDMFHMRFGERWQPAPLLKVLVTERKPRWPR